MANNEILYPVIRHLLVFLDAIIFWLATDVCCLGQA